MIGLLLPTRNKPEELERIIREVDQTSNGNVKLHAYVATDDPKLEEYKMVATRSAERNLYPDAHVTVTFGEPLGFSRAINFLAQQALQNPKVSLIMRCEDDFYFIENDWDLAYLYEVPDDGIAMIWCNYVLKGKDAEPHTAAVTRKWFNTVGYFSLPSLRHYFCDNVLIDLAKEIGRAIYIEKPYIDHRYNPHDERKKANFTEPQYDKDSTAYREWKNKDFKGDASRLKQQIS